MKRFTSFLISLLLAVFAMAQGETTTVTVNLSTGTFSSSTGTYCNGWTGTGSDGSNNYSVTISVGENNLVKNTVEYDEDITGLQLHESSDGSTWYLSVAGYKIVSYSFDFKSVDSNNNVTITPTGGESVTSSDVGQLLEVDCSSTASSFTLAGGNKGIKIANLTLKVRLPYALASLEVGQVYRFINVLYPTYSLNANSATDVNSVATSETDTKQQWYVEKQDGEYYVLRNLAYGKYLKGNGQSLAWSMSDDYSHDYNKFKLYTSNTDYNTLHTNTLGDYAYIHCNSSYNIVGWANGDTNTGSHWEITKVDYTTDEITALLEKAPTVAEVAAYPAALEAIFSDAACVTPALASLSAAQASEAYKALPATLKAMVDKVYREKTESVALETAWTEDNANADKASAGLNWNGEYAKKFRVQMYEPYSIAGDITGFLRMNAHANNDNPTGIYVPGGGTVYVMVEGNIKDGATLRLINAGSNNRITDATTGGYELKTGLNVINFAAEAGMLYICYNVDTYDPNGASEELKFPHKLSEYPPLKIHIEGGAINGFYSSCGDYLAGRSFGDDLSAENNLDLWGGVDDDNDWTYMEERANLSVLPIISHRQILLFQLNEENGQQGMKHFLPESVSVPETPFSYPQNGETSSWDDYDAYGMDCNTTTGKINIWMETWDRIMHAELATLGLISEDDVNIMNKFYPRWTSDGSKAEIYDMTNAGPDGNTYKVFCNGRDYSEYYNHHGVSLGTTSGYMSAGWNAANYNNSTFAELMGMPTSGDLWGPVHEIGHQFQDVFNIRGATEVTNNVFSNAATWYQGISTSRYNGGNLTTTLDNFNSGLPFIDYNIWSMTQMFYKLWLYYHLAGNNTQFYPRFFEMLRVDPLNAKGATATGTESMLKIYEKMCDAAGEDLTEFFRAHGFFVLLDNYAKGDYGTTIFTQTQEEVDAAIARVKAKYTKENFAVILINDGAEATLRHDGKTPRSFFDGTANPEYGGVNDFINGSATTGGTYEAVVNNDGTVTMKGEGGIGFLVFDENGNIISFSDNPTFALSDEAKESIMTGNVTVVSIGSDINAEPVVAEIDLTAMQKNILGELIVKAQQIKDKIDDTYTKIGFYKAAAVADLAAALENAETVYESASGYGAAYDLLYAEYQKVLENPDARIPFDPSLTYIITNKAYTNETMWVNDTLTVRSEGGVDQTADAAKWQFKATASDGVYYIYNKKGYYCPAVAQSTAMTATTTANADALYTLQEMETGVWAIKLSPAAGYSNFHSSWSNVVGWETGNNASRWYLTAVEPNATIADLTNLEVYITKTEALLGEVLGTVTYTTGENIALQTTTEGSAGYIWSNAPHSEGPIANLVDDVTTNYFHTDWQSGSDVTSGDHYIAVDLGAGNTLPRFAFSHTTRSWATDDFPKSVDVYGSDDNVTYKYLGSASDMPQSAGTSWQFDGMIISSHRYLRFNMHADRGYWHMAEFDIMPVTSFTATVNDTYSGTVTVETVQSAMEAMYNGKGVTLSMSPTEDNIDERLQALRSAYDALYNEYSDAITARKKTLAQLAANTQNLIKQVGTVTFAQETPVELNTGNFYCNAPYIASNNGDYSAEYVSKLTDGNNSTYLHTRWGANSDDGDYHYLRVDMGEGVSIGKFNFTYTTASRSKKDMPLTMVVEGANEIDGDNTTADTFTEIVTLTSLPEVLNTNTVYNSVVLGSKETPYRYLRFKVTDITVDEDDDNGHPFFTMAEFALNSVVEEETTVNSKYKSVVTEELLLASVHTTNSSVAMSTNALVTSVPMLDAQIADQQAAYDRLNEAMQQATCDKTELQAVYDEALALYNKMADGEGNVKEDYEPSTLTAELLAAAKTVLDAAKDKLDNSSDQDEIDAAKTAVDEKYTELLTIEEANVNLSGTFDKSELETLITNAAALLSTINGKAENNSDYYAAAGIAIDELQDAYDAAVDAKDRYYLTAEQYTAVKEALNNSYTTINPIVAADVAGRDELTTLIDNVKTLLGTIAEESAPKNVAVPLQSTAANGNFYIWCNSPAGDDDGVAGLIDKNADGTANTGTFLGTSWGSTVAAYTHYIEVDLGEGITIDKLLFDYTTRNSDHSNQRPTAIKILGSNDKTDYTEITIISEGLATERCQQWSMAETLELGAPYRYIRFAVATQDTTGYFNMSDFNLYAITAHTLALKEYYTTATGLGFDALCIALQSAQYAAEHYLTSEQLATVVEMLNGYYTTAKNIVEADVDNRTTLTDLVENTETLIEKVATVTEVAAVTLTEEMLYCNADNSTNSSAGDSDKRGVAALLDGDVSTHLHTTYGGNTQDDDLDHYIRVNLGEGSAVTAFKFSYKGRSTDSNNAPTDMLVQACATTDGEWVTFKTLTGLPTGTAPVSYESELIEMSEAYRYVRFMVTDTQNHSTNTPSGGTAHKFFVMSEFGFESYPTVDVDEEKYPNVTTALVRTAYNEKNSANKLATGYYMAESDYTAALGELQDAYDALEAAKVADKTALDNLIEATTLLKGNLYEITSYTSNKVTLSITEGDAGYIYCNAPEKNSAWATDNAGVAALIDLTDGGDPNLDTFLHTEYGSDQSADGLDHYLRVDLGADGATEYIEFGYYGRSGNTAKSPKKVIVAATNDLTDGGVWTTIATLNPAEASASDETKTGCLGNGVAYRYWRFLVKETYHNVKDGNNHPYFCMTQLNVYKCTDVVRSEQLKYTPYIYIYTTSELVTEVENAISAAEVVAGDEEVTQIEVNDAVDALQLVYDKLAEALKYAGVPVQITTDENNPILYKIISKRADDGSKVLQYDEPTTDKIAIVNAADNASYQAWYFMKGENGYQIKPFNGVGKMLSVAAIDDDPGSASIAETATYTEWDFARSSVQNCTEYFYIYVNGTNHACLSHNGGFNVTDKLGIWSGGWNTNDGGSLFKFVDAEFDNDNARYYQLSDFENTLEYQTSNTPEGTTVGAFTGGDAYSTAYSTANTLIEAGNTSDATACKDAYTALRTASKSLVKIIPEAGKIYRIYVTPGLTGARAGASMRIDDNGKLYCDTYAETNARFYFMFEYDDNGNLYMKNLHSGTYLDEALTDASNENVQVGADAESVTNAKSIAVNTLGKSGDAVVVGIVPTGGDMLNCAGKPGNVVAFDNAAVDKASAWVIEEVNQTESDIMENVAHGVSLTANGTDDDTKSYSSLFLAYNATIPDGVIASVVTGLNEIGQLIMEDVTEITGVAGVLPAKTAVILSGEVGGAATFNYTDTNVDFEGENILKGTTYTKLVNCATCDIYMLGKKNNRIAFYRAYENYNADGTKTGNNNDGGYVKCNANKSYLQMDEENNGNQAAAAAMFSFFFGNNTTDIDGINAIADVYKSVYDLQGRKLDKVTEPGVYIVNGKKIFVQEVE